jgi:hypothetical protein
MILLAFGLFWREKKTALCYSLQDFQEAGAVLREALPN